MVKILQINPNFYSKKLKCGNFSRISFSHSPQINNNSLKYEPLDLQAIKASSLAFLGKPKEIVTPEILYKKIQNQSMGVSLQHLQIMFDNINKILSRRGVKAYKEDILLTMWHLTQFANMEGVKNLNEQISSKTAASYKLYSQGSAVSLGNVLYYLSKSKGLFPYNECKPETVFMLDSLGLNVLQQKDKAGTLEDMNFSHLEFIYPLGWNEGINLFNQGKNYTKFEQNVADVVEKAYEKNTYFPNALEEVLSEDVREKAEKFEIKDVKFLSCPRDNFYVELEDIKNNLNPKIPTKKEVEVICQAVGEYCFKEYGDNKEYWTNLVAKYLYDGFIYYSPKKITEKLKDIYKEIEKNLPQNKTMQDVYFLMPQAGRSFSYVNYQFAQVNNISPDKFIHGDTDVAESEYSDKIFVYLDDISASGQTVLEELGGLNYNGLSEVDERMRDKIKLTTDNIRNQYMIATIYTTPSALLREEEEIEKRVRYDHSDKKIKDTIILTDTNKDEQVFYSEKEERDLSRIRTLFADVSHGVGGFYGLETRVIFPYMTPDSNVPLLKFLSQKFVPRSAIKTRIQPQELELIINKAINKKLN